jgi:ADP-dependent NAD(P)H-hydrate dehydratase / NAD(P)H-hydrate epimerase
MFGAAATRTVEHRASAGLPAHALMRQAGLAVARLALAVAPHARNVLVFAGPGNNGGDGFEAAAHLRAAGKVVSVVFVGDEAKLPADARDALERARAAGLTVTSDASGTAPDVVIDALLGVGANRAPSPALAACIRRINACSCPVLAVDIPSGLDAGTGTVLGDAAVQATHTLSLLTLKPGLFTGHGRDHAGDIWFDALDVSPQEAPDALLNGREVAQSPSRLHANHKGSFGDVSVIGGAPSMSGAALLAARAALSAGAGRVYASLLDDDAPALDVGRPELMFRNHGWQAADEVLARTTVVCGCGGGDAVRAVLPRVLSASGRLVLDADALNAMAQDSSLQALLKARVGRGRGTILTPHPLEAARLLGASVAEVQRDRLQAARELAQRLACAVLLKGSGTVIAAPGRTARINPTGNASLATAGTGDVLAGLIGGLWAQQESAEPQDVASAAAFRHGLAADLHHAGPLLAKDLVKALQRLPA